MQMNKIAERKGIDQKIKKQKMQNEKKKMRPKCGKYENNQRESKGPGLSRWRKWKSDMASEV